MSIRVSTKNTKDTKDTNIGSKKESKISSNTSNEIVLYNIDTQKNEKFVVRSGAQLTFEYTLGTAFEYKINDDDKFSDYLDMIRLVDSRGREHDVITKHVVLSGDMCLPVTKTNKHSYSGYSNSYSNGYSDPDDDDNEDYDVGFMDYVRSKDNRDNRDDEDDGYEYDNNNEDE